MTPTATRPRIRPIGAIEQGLSELCLEPPDLGAHAGLGDVFARRGAGEAALLGDRDGIKEGATFLQIAGRLHRQALDRDAHRCRARRA
jgi:hypothetical protein